MDEFFKQKNLANFVGNANVFKQVSNLVKSERGAGGASILLYGPEGVGKSTLCYQIARLILSNFEDVLVPEHKILNLTHADFFVLDGEAQENGKITVDSVREMISFTRYMPAESKFKVVIVDKLDNATQSAANALLKVLEEPPANTFIFLVADKIGSVLPTLRSRCLKFGFKGLNLQEFAQVLSTIDIFETKEAPSLLADVDDNCEKYVRLHKAAFGSTTLACALQENNMQDILKVVEEIILYKKKTLENIEYLINTVQSSFGWSVVKHSIFSVFMLKMKSELGDENLKKRVDYLLNLRSRFREVEVFNLDKKSLIYSVLC